MNSRFWPPVIGIGALLLLVTFLAHDGARKDSLSDAPTVAITSQNVQTEMPAPEQTAKLGKSVSVTMAPAQSTGGSSSSQRTIRPGANVAIARNAAGEVVMSVGEYIDPDDPSTWPENEGEVVSIGDYIDPDDPSTWPVEEDSELISVGRYLNPDDPASWPVSTSSEVIEIGEYRDPSQPESWPVEDDVEILSIGEYKNPDEPSSRN